MVLPPHEVAGLSLLLLEGSSTSKSCRQVEHAQSSLLCCFPYKATQPEKRYLSL